MLAASDEDEEIEKDINPTNTVYKTKGIKAEQQSQYLDKVDSTIKVSEINSSEFEGITTVRVRFLSSGKIS